MPSVDTPLAMAVSRPNAYVAVNSALPNTNPSVGAVYVVNFRSGSTTPVWALPWALSGIGNVAYGIAADPTGEYVTGYSVKAAIYEEDLYMFAFKLDLNGALVWQQTYATPEVPPFGALEVGEALGLDHSDGSGSLYVGGVGNYPGNFSGIRVWKYNALTGGGGLFQSISGAAGPVADVAATPSLCGLLYQAVSVSEISSSGLLLGTFSASETPCDLSVGVSGEIYALTKQTLRRFN